MNNRYHLPSVIDWPDDLSGAQRARLQRVILAAIQRAVRTSAAGGPQSANTTLDAEGGPPERWSYERYRPERDTYLIPSYNGGGAPTELPVVPGIIFEDDILIGTPDRVIEQRPPFQGALVMQLPGNRYIKVDSHHYAASDDIGRAHSWARALFGAESWVMVAASPKPGQIMYYVAALDTPLTEADLHVQQTQAAAARGQSLGYFSGFVLDRIPGDYSVVVVGFRDGGFAAPTAGGIEAYKAFIGHVHEARRQGTARLDPQLARTSIFKPIDDLIACNEVQRAAELLSELNATAFALLDWQTKARYLQVLIQAWTWQEEEIAIIEIVKSIESRSELDAALGLLRSGGIYDQMFDDLDSQIWSLLVEVGKKFGDPGPMTFGELVELMQEAGLLPRNLDEVASKITLGPAGPAVSADALAEIEEAALSFVRFLGGTVESVVMMVAHPDRLIEGIVQLVKLVVMVDLAEVGYPPAVQFVLRMLHNMAKQVLYGLRGAHVLGVSERVVRRIKWAVIWEIASWFIGVGEVKAILSSVGVGEKLAAIGRLLRILGLAGKVAEAEQAASKLEHLAMLLSKVGSLTREEDVLRLMSHLPEEELLELGRRLESADVHAARSMAELAAQQPELARAADNALRRAEALGRLEQRAGGLTEDLIEGFQRLAEHTELSNRQLLELMDTLHGERAELFMRAVRAMPEEALGTGIGARLPSFYPKLAERPQSMRFLVDANYETFSAMYRSANYDFARLEENLSALQDMVRELPAGQREVEYRRLLDRLAQEDQAAMKDLREAVNARRTAAGRPVLRSYSGAELDEIVRTTPNIQDIRRLAADMDNSSAGSLFERWVQRHVFGEQIGAARTRLRVRPENNPHLEELWQERVSDFYYKADGSVWDAKLYRSGSEVDALQLDDYRKMEEAGYVINADGRRIQVGSINYIFSDRAAADANRTFLHVQGGAEAWYIDDLGVLHHLD